jgi:hypothetical protein
MRPNLCFTATCAFAFVTSAAAQSCSAPASYPNTAYGVKSGCIPTNYNSAADLGNTNPTDAATRCAQNCAKASNCGGWAAQLNRAADSGLYTGTCFLYTTLPATPQACADKPSQLIAGVRDDTAKCFSSSKAAATAFCSSYLGIGKETVTVTAVASTTTTTTTLATTIPSTFTTLVALTATATTTTIRVATVPTRTTIVVTTTVTAVGQTTVTVTLQPIPEKKRAVAQQPACVAAGIPASQLTEQCKCLSIKSSTTTTTLTPSVVVVRATSTSTALTAIPVTQTTFATSFIVTTDIEVLLTTETVLATQTVTAPAVCVPTVPAGNILINPGFNDGTYNGWNPGGNGGFSNSITPDAQCGAYGARFDISTSDSYARIGQRFFSLDTSKRYQIQTYVKLLSDRANTAECDYYVTCQKPGSYSAADNIIVQTPLSDIPSAWTKMLVTCPAGANALMMSLTLQCSPGIGSVALAVDETAMYPQ